MKDIPEEFFKVFIWAFLKTICAGMILFLIYLTIMLHIEIRQLKKDNKTLLEMPCPQEFTADEILSDYKIKLSQWYDSIPILYPGINSMGGRR